MRIVLSFLLVLSLPALARDVPYQCSDTTITKMGTRLVGGTPADGVTLDFANGVHVGDGSAPTTALVERVGDKVQVCLIDAPTNCPEGNTYRVYDYRVQAAYKVRSSSHTNCPSE